MRGLRPPLSFLDPSIHSDGNFVTRMEHGKNAGMRSVLIWLIIGCVLIACMVLIGGITRLTDSGLSITEWKPIMGALPPMNAGEWDEAFTKYKQIPEYTLTNPDMDLAGFKRIFFWEYLHRNWGRMMGLVFFVPFVVFWRKGYLNGWLKVRSISILIGGGLVGALGWFMVASGLQDRVDVSHYRLAIHLCAAFSVYALVLWTVFDMRSTRAMIICDGTPPASWARWLLVLLALQIIWGAFTAGLDAGHMYNTWPLMNGSFMPENVRAFGDLVTDLSNHRDGVQFIHRNFAYVVALGFVVFAIAFRDDPRLRTLWLWLLAVVILQFGLGVATLLTHVRIELGALHQLGALALLSVLLKVLHVTGRATST